MKCLKCGCEDFILESTIVVTEKYKIYKNGKTSDHPISKIITQADMTDNENILRCTKCNKGYVLPLKFRKDLINRVDFSKVDLKTESIETEY